MSFVKEAWPFVLPIVAIALALFLFRHPWAGGAFALLALGVLLFFRDPHRVYQGDPAVVIAAADGVVTRVDTLEDPAVGPGRFHRVVTFLNVFDVHVQRVPVSGKVIATSLTRGKKVAAFREDAGEVNERLLTVLERDASVEGTAGDRIGVRQIAGLVARRVVGYLEPGQEVRQGEHLGVIKFGSRVDILVPESYEILVAKGDRMRGSETMVAKPGNNGDRRSP